MRSFTRKAALSLVGMLIFEASASAQENSVFSYQAYETSAAQCQKVTEFEYRAIVSALASEDLARAFATEFRKRSIPSESGAYINTAIDKAIYTNLANAAFREQKAAAYRRSHPDKDVIYANCISIRDEALRRVQETRGDEIEDMKGKPATTENILGESAVRNLDMMCKQVVDETYNWVVLAKQQPTEELARKKYQQTVRRANGFRNQSMPYTIKNLLLTNTNEFIAKGDEFRQSVADDVFGGKRTRSEHLNQCKKMAYEFWIKSI